MIKACIPYYDRISPHTQLSCDNAECAGLIEVRTCRGTVIHHARNRLIANSSLVHPKLEYEYYLCLDSDIGFTVDQLQKLIDHNLPIVSGAYVKNGQITGGWLEDRTVRWIKDGSGLHAVDWVGCGFLLIKREVLEKMPAPWFQFIEERRGENYITYSEDVWFCKKARELGYNIYIDLDCRLEHFKEAKNATERSNTHRISFQIPAAVPSLHIADFTEIGRIR